MILCIQWLSSSCSACCGVRRILNMLLLSWRRALDNELMVDILCEKDKTAFASEAIKMDLQMRKFDVQLPYGCRILLLAHKGYIVLLSRRYREKKKAFLDQSAMVLLKIWIISHSLHGLLKIIFVIFAAIVCLLLNLINFAEHNSLHIRLRWYRYLQQFENGFRRLLKLEVAKATLSREFVEKACIWVRGIVSSGVLRCARWSLFRVLN